MTEPNRKRGRPPGSGKKDGATLLEVARLMIGDPDLTPTTAMKRVYAAHKPWRETQETLVRRLQEKWRAQGQAMLDLARQERVPKPKTTLVDALAQLAASSSYFDRFTIRPELADAFERLARMPTWPDPKIMRQIDEVSRISKLVASYERHMPKFLGPTGTPDVFAKFSAFNDPMKKFGELQRQIDAATKAMNVYGWPTNTGRRDTVE